MSDLANPTTADLDAICKTIQEKIPEAMSISVSRNLMHGHYSWDLHMMVPRRDKAFRVMKGRFETLRVDNGETLEGMVEKALDYFHYHCTGKLRRTEDES